MKMAKNLCVEPGELQLLGRKTCALWWVLVRSACAVQGTNELGVPEEDELNKKTLKKNELNQMPCFNPLKPSASSSVHRGETPREVYLVQTRLSVR